MPRLQWSLYACPIVNSASPFERDLSRLNPSEAKFQTIADGGFGSATLTFENVTKALLEEAFNDWRMKRVLVTDSAGLVAYEGFIGEIEIDYGYHNYVWSIDPFFNKAIVTYNTTVKGATKTLLAFVYETDVDSTYTSTTQIGIKEEWIDYGNELTIEAQAIRKGKQEMTKVLKPMAARLNLGGGATLANNTLTLTMIGAFATLQWRKTTAKAATLTQIHTLIGTILTSGAYAQYINTSDLTQLASAGQTITYNTNSQAQWLQDAILGAIEGGDSAGRRLFFQIAPGRIPVLYTRATAPAYFSRHNEWRILNQDRGVIPAYLVKAGGYVQADDMTANLDEPSDVIARPRAALIEETNYDTLTDTLTIAPPASLLDTRRLHARYHKRGRDKQFN